MNLIFGLFMESWILRFSCKVSFTLTLQETRSIHDSRNKPKIEFITYIFILYYLSSINFLFSPNLAGFPDTLNKADITEVSEEPKRQISVLNIMGIRVKRHTNVSKQTTLLDGVDVGPPIRGVCGRSLNWSVHEGTNNISNVKVHLKTHSGNVNIIILLQFIHLVY